jgi:hypothetical protein
VEVVIENNTVSPALVDLLVIDSPDKGDSDVAQALSAAGIEFEYRRADVSNPILRVGIKKPSL